jgi:hypothetical protein
MSHNCILHIVHSVFNYIKNVDVNNEPFRLYSYSLTHFLLEKLIGSQTVKKLPTFYGTQRFITAFTIAHHLALSRSSPIQFIHIHILLPEDPS